MFITSDVWHCYKCLSPNQHGMGEISTCIKVGIESRQTTMRTRKTTKGTRAKLSASVADLGSVMRLNFLNYNSLSFSFILDEFLQLEKTPIAYPIIKSFSSSLFSYSFEIFHHNLVSFERGNNLFADIVINPRHITSFSSRELFEKPLTGTSAFGLKNRTQISEFSFDLLDFGRFEKLAVGSDCQVVYSEVNAKNKVLRSIVNDIDLFGECEQEKSPAFSVHSQMAFADFPREIFPITFRNIELEFLPCLEQSQDENISFEIGISWKIISNRSLFDNGFCFGFFDDSASLCNAGDCKLRRQNFPQSQINKRMQFNIIPYLFTPSDINTNLQSFGISLDSLDYLGSCTNFDFSYCDASHRGCEERTVYKPFGGWYNVV